MLTRKHSIKSRTRRARRKQSKFLTPDLALFRGQILRFVANQDSPLSEAERLRGESARLSERRKAVAERRRGDLAGQRRRPFSRLMRRFLAHWSTRAQYKTIANGMWRLFR
jgi:hypothetical protein